jgi:RNA polymerase sigma-70 factor (ECF subfamily)
MTKQDSIQTSQTLLLRVRCADDREAWQAFVHRYGPRIFYWCRQFRLQESDAADVTQEVLLKLVRVMRDFRYDPTRGTFQSWLKTVTANAARDTLAKWRQADRGSGDTAVCQALSEMEDERMLESLSQEIERSHRQELLAQAERVVRQRVHANTWQAYRLTTVEQFSSAEAAAKLGMPISEVYVAKSRVLKMIREHIRVLTAET